MFSYLRGARLRISTVNYSAIRILVSLYSCLRLSKKIKTSQRPARWSRLLLNKIMTFQELNLNPLLLKALTAKGYVNPTEIQQKAVPVVLKGRDVLASAQTGTGKTAAFTLPLLHLMAEKHLQTGRTARRQLTTLVLTPTRELAIQISENIETYKQGLPIRHLTVFGGVSQHEQVRQLAAGTDLLVATPGRLLDLLQQGLVDLSHVAFFVLDEADRMLDSGFLKDVKRIITKLPVKRQTLLFSATVPAEIKELADKLLNNPARVEVHPVSSAAPKIDQSVYHVEKHLKQSLLIELLEQKNINRVLVFTTMKHHADKLAKQLVRSGIRTEAIHGNKSQKQRQEALDRFKSNKVRVLIATDVVARGIDIDDLTHVINFELPDVAETYVHRIGRTGRKGNQGTAISFCSSEERLQLKSIQKLISRSIPVASLNQPFVSSMN